MKWEFLLQIGVFAFSEDYGPITSFRSFVWITVGLGFQGDPRREVAHWKHSLASYDVGEAVVVDIPARNLFSLQKLLCSEELKRTHKPIKWERAGPSRSNSKAEPRVMMRGFLPQVGINLFDAKLVSREVQRVVRNLGGFVGLRSMYEDKASLLVEVTNVDALQAVQPLCDSILTLSPKWALVSTSVRSEQWVEVISTLMRDNPYSCVLRVQWRQSLHGGRPWAVPAATSQQIQAVRVQARVRMSQGESGCESSLVLSGSLGPEPENVIRYVMGAVQTRMGLTFKEALQEHELGTCEWVMCLDAGDSTPNGRVRVKLPNTSSAKMLESVVRDQVVVVGGDSVALQVNNYQVMDLPRCLGNEGGVLTAPLRPPPGL